MNIVVKVSCNSFDDWKKEFDGHDARAKDMNLSSWYLDSNLSQQGDSCSINYRPCHLYYSIYFDWR